MADSIQVGGTYYRTGYQHWDWMNDMGWGLAWYTGNAVKYIVRWRAKGYSLDDLRKAKHYVEKLIQTSPERRETVPASAWELTAHLCRAYKVNEREERLIYALTVWSERNELIDALKHFDELFVLGEDVSSAVQGKLPLHEPRPVPLEDSNKHAER